MFTEFSFGLSTVFVSIDLLPVILTLFLLSLFKMVGKPSNLNILAYCSYGLFVAVLFSSNFYAICDRQGSRAVHPNNLGDFFPLFSLNDNRKANCFLPLFPILKSLQKENDDFMLLEQVSLFDLASHVAILLPFVDAVCCLLYCCLVFVAAVCILF